MSLLTLSFTDRHLTDAASLQSLKKSKKDKEREEVVIPAEDLSPLAHPLANKKLLKKLHKTIKKGACPQTQQRQKYLTKLPCNCPV